MSSHHIIRENQEPALLIQDFNALDLQSLGQLLEWSPTIIANDESIDSLLSEGIKVDVLFSKEDLFYSQEHLKEVLLKQDFLSQGLLYLIENNHKAVNILSNYFLEDLYSLAKDINIVLFYNCKRYVFVSSLFEKWKPKGEKVYIDESRIKSFQGLVYKEAGIFETISDGFIRLEFNTIDFVIIGEDL